MSLEALPSTSKSFMSLENWQFAPVWAHTWHPSPLPWEACSSPAQLQATPPGQEKTCELTHQQAQRARLKVRVSRTGPAHLPPPSPSPRGKAEKTGGLSSPNPRAHLQNTCLSRPEIREGATDVCRGKQGGEPSSDPRSRKVTQLNLTSDQGGVGGSGF